MAKNSRFVFVVLGALVVSVALVRTWPHLALPKPTGTPERAERAAATSEPVVGNLATSTVPLPRADDGAVAAESPEFADLVIPPDGELDAQGLQQLDREARAGHDEAACRLAAEMSRCNLLDYIQRTEPPVDPAQIAAWNLPDDELRQYVDYAARRRQRIDAAKELCTVVRATLPGEHLDYFTLAAANGHVPTQIVYLTGNHLRPRDVIRRPALVEEYRTQARRYFENALARGDLALLQVWFNYTQSPEALQEVLPIEWRDPAFVQALVEHLDDTQREATFPHDEFRHGGDHTPTPPQRDAAALLYRRYFADSPPPEIETFIPPRHIAEFDLDRYRCDAASR